MRKSLKPLHPNLERQSAERSLWTYPVLIFFPGTTVMQDTWTRCAIDLNTWSIRNSSVQYLPRKLKIPEPEHNIFQMRESIARVFGWIGLMRCLWSILSFGPNREYLTQHPSQLYFVLTNYYFSMKVVIKNSDQMRQLLPTAHFLASCDDWDTAATRKNIIQQGKRDLSVNLHLAGVWNSCSGFELVLICWTVGIRSLR